MRNTETHTFNTDSDALAVLLTDAKKEERKDRALAVSIRLEALAIHITREGMSGTEAAELLRREAYSFDFEHVVCHCFSFRFLVEFFREGGAGEGGGCFSVVVHHCGESKQVD